MINDTKQVVNQICEILYDKKATDIVYIDIADKSVIADYFIICSGRNNQLVKALCDEVEGKMALEGLRARRKEGYNEGRWIVIDYADILIHIFHPQEREYFNIERLWKDDSNFTDYSAMREKQLMEKSE